MLYFRLLIIAVLLGLPVLFSGCTRWVSSGQERSLLSMSEPELRTYLQKAARDTTAITEFTPDRKLTPGQCLADLVILKRAMMSAQPALYRYSSRPQMDSVFQVALDACRDSLSYTEMLRVIGPVISQMRCVHTHWGNSAQFLAYRRANIPLMPVDVRVINGTIYVHRDLSLDNRIAPGSRIVRINGRPAAGILHTLQGCIESDGTVKSYKLGTVGYYFSKLYGALIARPDTFHLDVVPPKGIMPKRLAVLPLKMDVLDSVRRSRYCISGLPEKPLQFGYIDSAKTAVYTIRSFNKEYIREQGQHFMVFTDSVFAIMKDRQMSNLIIDIRDNSGGWTANGKHLFSYFIDKPMPVFESILVRQSGDYFFAPVMTQDPGYDSTVTLIKRPDGLMAWTNNMNLNAKPAPAGQFKGRVIILINGQSLSCSSFFATLMSEHTDAMFIGEESGGASCGPNGMITSFKLPYSKIEITLSTAQYNIDIADKSNSRGVMPDIAIQPTIEDILNGDDVVMKEALRILKRR